MLTFTGLQLPFEFDCRKLQSDLTLILPEEWREHYNERDYGGQWRGVALRSLTGDANHLISSSQAPAGNWADTSLLVRCQYFAEVLQVFQCPLKSVRLLSLSPGSFIREHSDPALGYEDGEVRIHIPIQTNAGVEFYTSGRRVSLQEGSCYYINVSQPHNVSNRGVKSRIHLVIDADVNDWVHALFRRGREIPATAPRPESFQSFRSTVLTQPELQHALHRQSGSFPQSLVAAGRERGFDFEESEAGAMADPGAPPPHIPNLLAEWVPVKVRLQEDRLLSKWVYLGRTRFTEPFFEETIRIALRNPFAKAFQVEAPVPPASGPPPSGFIFHMSRCGSTLVARAFAALDSVVMLSEAPPIDDVLQSNPTVQNLRSIVSALGQRRSGQERHVVIKLDAWHIHYLPLFRLAFPNTPWVFVHRDPVEVLMSQLRQPGMLALPGAMNPAALHMKRSDVTGLARETWCAHVLAGFLKSALAQCTVELGMFVDYAQLPGAIHDVARHFQIAISANDRRRLDAITQLDSKMPSQAFRKDRGDPLAGAAVALRDASGLALRTSHQELMAVCGGRASDARGLPA